MSNQPAKKIQQERAALLAELGTLSRLLHGSWVERYALCARPDCKCRRGQRHGPRRYLVVNEGGHQRPKDVPNAQVARALEGIAQYRRLQEIVERITRINLALMRENDHEDS